MEIPNPFPYHLRILGNIELLGYGFDIFVSARLSGLFLQSNEILLA
jgi:hypothetical protein